VVPRPLAYFKYFTFYKEELKATKEQILHMEKREFAGGAVGRWFIPKITL